MSRLARLVVPGLPYHVAQRGNGGQRMFFSDEDYACYRDLLAAAAAEARVSDTGLRGRGWIKHG